MSEAIARLVIVETHEKEYGQGIVQKECSTWDRDMVLPNPITLALGAKIAGSILSPLRQTVRAFSASHSLIGEWSFNEKKAAEVQAKQLKGETKAEQKKRVKDMSPAERAIHKQLAAVKKEEKRVESAEDERELLAKAPKALLPMVGSHRKPDIIVRRAATAHDMTQVLSDWRSNTRMTPVPLVHSESTVGISLTRQDGSDVTIPIHEGIFTSAMSRGKTEAKKDPSFDPLFFAKLLMAEIMLGADTSATYMTKEKEEKVRVNCYRSARLFNTGQKVNIILSRDEALRILRAPKGEVYQRRAITVFAKKSTPFGANCLKWQGRAKDDRAIFSKG